MVAGQPVQRLVIVFRLACAVALVVMVGAPDLARSGPHTQGQTKSAFRTADACVACHNRLVSPAGEDVSIGSEWRGSVMANSARDPYWQAAVRRETLDHPRAATAIEDTCATCHMPMSRADAHAADRAGQVFAHLPLRARTTPGDRVAHDGVSCTMCHQISDRDLASVASFSGGFAIHPRSSAGAPSIFGRLQASPGSAAIMESSSSYRPVESAHVQTSELCATCHTLFIRALGPSGETIGTLPEQTTFLEWRHSGFPAERTCQACHMPVVQGPVPIASVLGTPRETLARHGFRGGNFFILAALNRYRRELGVEALPDELELAARRTVGQLQSDTATVSIARADRDGRRLAIEVAVENLSGHKFPTGFPSRRAWLHVTVRDRSGRPLFESGAVRPDGRIEGNDNDDDPLRVEPHFADIDRADQVQIYESIVRDAHGNATTGIVNGVGFVKDNRLLPRGFDKSTAEPVVAVIGSARSDADFVAGADHVRYSVDVAGGEAPYAIDVELRYQPVGFRWAHSLATYNAAETRRFVGYYEAMASASSITIAQARTTFGAP